ncbi:MAG: hypothetical protein K9L88_10630 [Chromatiaceae bacterium]|nr:hypothetical protein [Chromatiaceae bacterium]
MGTRNTPEQTRYYVEQTRERQRRAGLKRRELLAHDDDWSSIKTLAERLKAKRINGANQ